MSQALELRWNDAIFPWFRVLAPIRTQVGAKPHWRARIGQRVVAMGSWRTVRLTDATITVKVAFGNALGRSSFESRAVYHEVPAK